MQLQDRTALVTGADSGIGQAIAIAFARAGANGDLFSHIAAFAPGFLTPLPPAGRPAIFIAHGTRDRVLPIERCSRRIVPALRAAGYAPRYQEFDGGHIIAPRVALAALRWLRETGRPAPPALG